MATPAVQDVSAHDVSVPRSRRAELIYQRDLRNKSVCEMLEQLILVSKTHIVKDSHRAKNPTPDKKAETARENFEKKIKHIATFVSTFKQGNITATGHHNTTIIARYNNQVNYLNTLSVNLGKKPVRLLADDFERFVVGKAFPTYDKTSGFATDDSARAQIDKIANPAMPVITASYTGDTFDLSREENKHYASSFFIIRTSLTPNGTIFATDESFDYMNALCSGIDHATAVVKFGVSVVPTPFSARNNGFGSFDSFSLALNFGGKIVNSSCKYLQNQLQEIKNGEEKYTTLCRRKIIDLISINPAIIAPSKLVFCRHPSCKSADGFIFNPTNAFQTEPACAHEHPFCLSCLQPKHDGLCDGDDRTDLVDDTQKPCPACKTIIYKTDGCNHMTCTRCNQHFCWLCLRTFSRSDRYVRHDGCNQFDAQPLLTPQEIHEIDNIGNVDDDSDDDFGDVVADMDDNDAIDAIRAQFNA